MLADVDARPGGRRLQQQLQVRRWPADVVHADAKARGRSSARRWWDKLLGECVWVTEIIRKQLVLECAIIVVRIRLTIAAREEAIESSHAGSTIERFLKRDCLRQTGNRKTSSEKSRTGNDFSSAHWFSFPQK